MLKFPWMVSGARETRPRRWSTGWRWLGLLAGAILLVWVLRGVDPARLAELFAAADYRALLLLPVVAIAEQLVRAVKWRIMLHPVCRVGVGRLFGAIMAGYFANLVIPARVSPLVRAWLIARLEKLRLGTVLATVALDRLIDGLVFVVFGLAAALLVRFPVQTERVEEGLLWATTGSLFAFLALIVVLLAMRRRPDRFAAVARRLPARVAPRVAGFIESFADGVVIPDARWRQAAIILASAVIKLIAVSWFVFAGFAFGVVLAPMEYVFLMVFLGFLVILGGMLGLVGGFTAGAVFALDGFGVPTETALAMVLVVQATAILTVSITGLGALWVQGVKLSDLRAAAREAVAGGRHG